MASDAAENLAWRQILPHQHTIQYRVNKIGNNLTPVETTAPKTGVVLQQLQPDRNIWQK
jgi:hypothetical protein